LVRAVPYQLEKGRLADAAAASLRAELTKRLRAAQDLTMPDSPLFQLLPSFPGIDLPHDVTDAFQDRVQHEEQFRAILDQARNRPTNETRRQALLEIQRSLGDVKTVQRSILVDLLLSYRAVEAWNEMVDLCDAFPDHLKDVVVVRQQWALALNRRNHPGDRDKAVRLLDDLVKQRGADPETLGILGRVHKDRYRDAKKSGIIMAIAALDDAIAAYTKGFESDPRDYYPGVNAITLLVEKGDADAMKEVARLVPLVAFAVARRGGATSSDYWDLATVLELSCIGSDWTTAARVLPRVVAAARESWMPETTIGNLELLKQARRRQGQTVERIDGIVDELRKPATQIQGSAPGAT
jgi:tetratricopeptide (TPR) repeat protein